MRWCGSSVKCSCSHGGWTGAVQGSQVASVCVRAQHQAGIRGFPEPSSISAGQMPESAAMRITSGSVSMASCPSHSASPSPAGPLRARPVRHRVPFRQRWVLPGAADLAAHPDVAVGAGQYTGCDLGPGVVLADTVGAEVLEVPDARGQRPQPSGEVGARGIEPVCQMDLAVGECPLGDGSGHEDALPVGEFGTRCPVDVLSVAQVEASASSSGPALGTASHDVLKRRT